MIKLPKLRATSGELLHLDLLRFIASAGIVFHHSHEFFVPRAIRAGYMFSRTGGLALFVDLFFTISGFIIAYVYTNAIREPFGYGKFLQRRFGRLVPLHWLTLAVALVFYGILSTTGVSLNHRPSAAPACIAETAFLLHSVIPCGNGIYFNGQSWSISAELVMYLCFPLFALAARWRRWIPLLLAILIFVAIGVREHLVANATYFDWTELSPVLRALPSFLLGVGAFHYRSTIANLVPSSVFAMILTVFSLTAAMLEGAPTFVTLLLVYLTFIFAVAADISRPTHLVRVLAPLGQLTYSIYMWHYLLISIIMNGLGDKFLHLTRAPMIVLAILCYAAILVTSYLSFFFIETPARRWIDNLNLRLTWLQKVN